MGRAGSASQCRVLQPEDPILAQGFTAPGSAARADALRLDRTMKASVGLGLEFFKPERTLIPWDPDAEPLTSETWKHLDLGCDQEGSGMPESVTRLGALPALLCTSPSCPPSSLVSCE